MMPTFPIIEINDLGCLIGTEKLDDMTRCSLVGICQRRYERASYYDSKGILWSVRVSKAPYPVNIWTKIMGQIYNPRFSVELQWVTERPYEFRELQEAICKCVDMDDDILTQFIEADKLKKLVLETSDFHHLFNRLKKMRLVCR